MVIISSAFAAVDIMVVTDEISENSAKNRFDIQYQYAIAPDKQSTNQKTSRNACSLSLSG